MSLTIKAATLAGAAPQEWRAFLAELSAYFTTKQDELLKAPVTELQKAQGRAQAIAILLDQLQGAVQGAERIVKLEERRK
jgi:hypothetical protein